MVKRHGWAGGVVLTFLAAAVWMLLPGTARAGETKNVQSNFDVRLGGYVQMNLTWDSDEAVGESPNNMRANATDLTTPEMTGREGLRWTAARTRLLTDVRGPEVWGGKTRAYVELDFDGTHDGSSHADTPRLRRAYMRYDWPSFWLLIGQDTMLFTDAVGSESEISGTTSGSRGDITGGSRNRTPQFKFGIPVQAGAAKLELLGSVAHNGTGRDSADTSDNDSGSRAKIPALTAMGKLTVPVGGRDAVLAASYIFMQEKFVTGTQERNVHSRGVAIEAIVPVSLPGLGSFDARGNYFWGENLARVSLGNNTGVSRTGATIATIKPNEVSSWGWWAEANWYTPVQGLALGGGYGRLQDDVNDLLGGLGAATGGVCGSTGLCVETNHGMWVFVKYTTGPIMHFVQYSDIETVRLSLAAATLNQRTTSDSQELHYVARYRF